MVKLLFLSALLIGGAGTHYWGSEPQYTGEGILHLFDGATSSTILGPAAPAFGTCGVWYGQEFTAPAEQSYHGGPLIPCWTGTDDISIFIYFSGEAADPIADGETVIFDFVYRTVGPTGGTGLGGNTVTLQATYTQSGAGADCEAPLLAVVVFDRTDGDQPYTYFDTIMGTLSRSGGTYGGDPIVGNVVFAIPYKQVCHAG